MLNFIMCLCFLNFKIPKKEIAAQMNYKPYILECNNHEYVITLTDIELLERCVMTEAGSESLECKVAVLNTIYNRVFSPYFKNDIESVIYDGYSLHDNGDPTNECRYAVLVSIIYFNKRYYPTQMYYFRANKYHDFGIPYMHIDHTFFSLQDNTCL